MTTRADLIDTAARALAPWDGLAPNVRRAQAVAVLDAVLPQITTAEQLEALPIDTRLVGEGGRIWRKPPGHGYLDKLSGTDEGWWHTADALKQGPLTVVYRPQPDQETADA